MSESGESTTKAAEAAPPPAAPTGPTLVLSPGQQIAEDAVLAWYNKGKAISPFFYLAGYAGTGKSSIAAQIVAKLQAAAPEGKPFIVNYCAFTGKASLVLQKKGSTPASTIHRLIYKPIFDPQTGKLEGFDLRPKEDLQSINLFVLDECSMVGEELGEDLLSFGIPILVLGDPGQLPPIGGAGFFTSGTPDAFLEEIHRQAADSPIIKLAWKLRNGEKLMAGQYRDPQGRVSLVARQQPTIDQLLAHDQVIVGMHRTRKALNMRMRNALGFTEPYPMIGDKLICLRNEWKIPGMVNGAMWKVLGVDKFDNGKKMFLEMSDWDQPDQKVNITSHAGWFDVPGIDAIKDGPSRRGLVELTFGNAITCHKAQGSQWVNPLIIDEGFAFREDADKWRYTALTRAQEQFRWVS